MRSITTALALAIAGAFPSAADDLLQGHFMAAPYMADDTLLPRYITLEIEGEEMELSFLSLIAMDQGACQQDQQCDYRVPAASAMLELDGQRLNLNDVEIDPSAAIDEPRFGPPAERYTRPLLDAMNGAVYVVTAHGFDLRFADDVLSFFRAEPDVQTAIAAVPVSMSLSIGLTDGCEVRMLAPLFAVPDPDPALAIYLDGLRGMAARVAMINALVELGDVFVLDEDHPDLLARGRLAAAINLPQIIAFTTSSEAPFEDRLAEAMAADVRPAFEPGDAARYGGRLPAVVALYDHWNTEPGISEEALCTDPSFGFIAAQGG